MRALLATAFCLSACARTPCPVAVKTAALANVEACTLAYEQATTEREIEKLDGVCLTYADVLDELENGGAEQICKVGTR